MATVSSDKKPTQTTASKKGFVHFFLTTFGEQLPPVVLLQVFVLLPYLLYVAVQDCDKNKTLKNFLNESVWQTNSQVCCLLLVV